MSRRLLVPGALHALSDEMSANTLLERLERSDLRLLERHLEPVDLPLRRRLEERNKTIEHVSFLDSGVASVVSNGSRPLEIGMIGREGMTGAAIVLGNRDRVLNETYMQIAGNGHRLSVGQLQKAITASPALHLTLLRYVHRFLAQTAQTALANGRNKLEERLARWLLLAHDRIDGDELPLTHEFLAIMLGVGRSGVTAALTELARKGLITHRRAVIAVVDREGLEAFSNGAYSVAADRETVDF